VIEKGSTCGCEFDAAGAAREELRAHLAFKISNLPAQGRLRCVQFSLGGHGQTPRFGHRNEISKMSQFHSYSYASRASPPA
jgi:hypothetical protein